MLSKPRTARRRKGTATPVADEIPTPIQASEGPIDPATPVADATQPERKLDEGYIKERLAETDRDLASARADYGAYYQGKTMAQWPRPVLQALGEATEKLNEATGKATAGDLTEARTLVFAAKNAITTSRYEQHRDRFGRFPRIHQDAGLATAQKAYLAFAAAQKLAGRERSEKLRIASNLMRNANMAVCDSKNAVVQDAGLYDRLSEKSSANLAEIRAALATTSAPRT